MSEEMTAREFLAAIKNMCRYYIWCHNCPLYDGYRCTLADPRRLQVGETLKVVSDNLEKQKAASTTNADDL